MKAVILNSGYGHRMGALTRDCHKSMVRLSNGETVFHRQLRLLQDCGVEQVVVTTGPFAWQLQEEAAGADLAALHVTFVDNPQFAQTNYIYSLYLARAYLDDDILLMHGDLVFDRAYLEALRKADASCLGAVHTEKALPQKDFKARLQDGKITEISINIFDADCFAFQPLYKLDRQTFKAWMDRIGDFVQRGEVGVYAENAFNTILPSLCLQPFSYKAHYVDEIDTPEDLARVSEEIRAFDFDEQRVQDGLHCIHMLPDVLRAVRAKKVMLVCDANVYDKLGVQAVLTRAGIPTVRFDAFTSNPKYEEAAAGTALFLREGCDALLSVGGGSCIDVAKCIKLFSVLKQDGHYLEQPFQYAPAVHIAVPTTAGTGAESTRFSVIYRDGEKQSVTHDCILPEYALLDATLLKTLPAYQKRAAFMDAVCHCVEAIWSRHANEKAAAYAKEGLSLLLTHARAYLEGDETAAQQILRGANRAGRAINLAQTTAAHAMSYKMTSCFHIAHGHAAALCLAPVWRFLWEHREQAADPAALQRAFAALAACFHADDGLGALDVYASLLTQMGFSPLPAVRTAMLEEIAQSVNETRLANSPVRMDTAQLREMYTYILQIA
ncbi:MAG: iron-containing alcohol dehydrogenase [Clostridia bacterium]|nr:iron-containing alcohol dehydrogenase [Clostridia bacterium]